MTPYTTCPIFLAHDKLPYSIQIKPNTFVAQLVSSAADISLVNLEHFIFLLPLAFVFHAITRGTFSSFNKKKNKNKMKNSTSKLIGQRTTMSVSINSEY